MKKILLILILMMALMFSNTVYAAVDIDGPDTIFKQKDRVLTVSQILPLYSSIHGTVVVLQDNYTGFGNIPGIYTIKFGVEGTAFEKLVNISVRNVIGNVIAVTLKSDIYTIHLHKTQILTPQGIVDILVNIQFITVTSTTEISILSDTYTDNSNAPGTYVFEFHLATTSGNEETHEINLKVNDTAQLMPDIVVEHVTLWEVIWPALKTIVTLLVIILITYILITLILKKKKRGR